VTQGMEKSSVKQWLKPQYLMGLLLVVVVVGAAFIIFNLQRGQVVATVNGEKITRDELYEAMYTQVGQEAIDEIITRRLIVQEGQRLGLAVSDAEVDAEIDKIIEENFMGMKEQFLEILEQYGVSLETVMNDTRLNLMVQKIARSQIEVTDEDARDYFEANKAVFNVPDEVDARHILVETEAAALEVLELLRQGGDFAELAAEHSQDPGSKDDGGNLGFFKPGDMLPEFEEVAFSMAVGDISEPVETWYGFHVIEVLAIKSGRAVTFDEVKEEVHERLLDEKSYGMIQDLIVKLREDAEIDYL
jgi:foldase protein PrsA